MYYSNIYYNLWSQCRYPFVCYMHHYNTKRIWSNKSTRYPERMQQLQLRDTTQRPVTADPSELLVVTDAVFLARSVITLQVTRCCVYDTSKSCPRLCSWGFRCFVVENEPYQSRKLHQASPLPRHCTKDVQTNGLAFQFIIWVWVVRMGFIGYPTLTFWT